MSTRLNKAADSSPKIEEHEKNKYFQIFNKLCPVNGLLSGSKVKAVLMQSKLPVEVLSKVWDLSDIDRDGFLDKDEFCIAMHLVYQALKQDPVPEQLPPSLIPPNKRTAVTPPSFPLNASTPPQTPLSKASTWVVTSSFKTSTDITFRQLDSEDSGLLSGSQIRDHFIVYNIPQNILAHIWNLCDIFHVGALNAEQFALAEWLIARYREGTNPPTVLLPDMIPPSCTPPSQTISTDTELNIEEFTSPELRSLAQEILSLEKDLQEAENEVKLKQENVSVTEQKNLRLHDDLDRINRLMGDTGRELQITQSRADEQDIEKKRLATEVDEIQLRCQKEMELVATLGQQIQHNTSSLENQEHQLKTAQAELDRLNREEIQLLEKFKQKEKHLADALRQLNAAASEFEELKSRIIESGGTYSTINPALQSDSLPFPDEDPFQNADPFSAEKKEVDPFADADPFADPFNSTVDPFADSSDFVKVDPFANSNDFVKVDHNFAPVSTSSSFAAIPPKRPPPPSSMVNNMVGSFANTSRSDDPLNVNDPFAMPSTASNDPFSSHSFGETSKNDFNFPNVNSSDPFGSSGNDPFFSSATTHKSNNLDSGSFADAFSTMSVSNQSSTQNLKNTNMFGDDLFSSSSVFPSAESHNKQSLTSLDSKSDKGYAVGLFNKPEVEQKQSAFPNINDLLLSNTMSVTQDGPKSLDSYLNIEEKEPNIEVTSKSTSNLLDDFMAISLPASGDGEKSFPAFVDSASEPVQKVASVTDFTPEMVSGLIEPIENLNMLANNDFKNDFPQTVYAGNSRGDQLFASKNDCMDAFVSSIDSADTERSTPQPAASDFKVVNDEFLKDPINDVDDEFVDKDTFDNSTLKSNNDTFMITADNFSTKSDSSIKSCHEFTANSKNDPFSNNKDEIMFPSTNSFSADPFSSNDNINKLKEENFSTNDFFSNNDPFNTASNDPFASSNFNAAGSSSKDADPFTSPSKETFKVAAKEDFFGGTNFDSFASPTQSHDGVSIENDPFSEHKSSSAEEMFPTIHQPPLSSETNISNITPVQHGDKWDSIDDTGFSDNF